MQQHSTKVALGMLLQGDSITGHVGTTGRPMHRAGNGSEVDSGTGHVRFVKYRLYLVSSWLVHHAWALQLTLSSKGDQFAVGFGDGIPGTMGRGVADHGQEAPGKNPTRNKRESNGQHRRRHRASLLQRSQPNAQQRVAIYSILNQSCTTPCATSSSPVLHMNVEGLSTIGSHSTPTAWG